MEPRAERRRSAQQRLDTLVTRVASRLTPVDASSFVAVSEQVLHDLVEHFEVDTCFLRFNDHERRATVLVSEWPVRDDVPDPDPLGVVYFDDADPLFARAEHLRDVVLTRPGEYGTDYDERVETAAGVPGVSMAAVPLLSGETTTGTLGFIKFGDRAWTEAEVDVLRAIAALLAQVQARVRAEDDLRYAANHDSLTGLASRRALFEHLDARLRPGESGPVALVFVDLDRLKPLNDFLGHVAADSFLCKTAQRLVDECAPEDLVARLGGDEFVIVLAGAVSLADGYARADALRQAVGRSVRIGSEVVGRSASLGVVVGEPGRDTATMLLGQGDQAMMVAKGRGGNSVVAFTDDLKYAGERRNLIELGLRASIDTGQLTLDYQPEVDLRTGRIRGVEALVRWDHPVLGRVQPLEFVEVAEVTNLAGDLGRWVLRTACAQFADWRKRIPGLDLTLSVNVSPVQLVGLDFVGTVEGVLQRYRIDSSLLCLEITEHAVVGDIARTRDTLERLALTGVGFAIDDFGTGYSSLGHLKSLPVDTLKIDRGFVQNLGRSAGDRVIVASIIGLAAAFGLDVVAEGLETEEAAMQLLELGCHRAQGFLLSRPQPPDAMERLLRTGFVALPWIEYGPHD